MSGRIFICFILIALGFFPGIIFPEQIAIKKVGEWGTGLYKDVYVQGDYAYCAAEEVGLDIIDISNPAAPLKVGGVDTPRAAVGVIVINNCAYIKELSRSGLRMADVTNPSQPILKGTAYICEDARKIDVKGTHAYIADGSWLRIINAENPFFPTLMGESEIDGDLMDLCVKGDYVYAAAGVEANGRHRCALLIFDISNPGKPRQVGHYYSSYYINPDVVYVQGNFAYLGFRGNIMVIDVSNPKSPKEVVNLDGFQRHIRGIHINGSYGYLVDEANKLKIIELSDLTSPTLVGSYKPTGNICGMDFSNGSVFLAAEFGGLHIVDVSDPFSPTQLGCYDTSGYAVNLDVNGDYVYLAHHYGGLQIIDISEPDSPTKIGSYDTSDYIYNVSFWDNHAYVVDVWDGLEILDVSNPSFPVLMGNIDISGGTFDVLAVNDFAYVAYCVGGLKIVDVSNPASPQAMGSYSIGGCASGIDVRDDLVYLAVFIERLEIIDVSNPSAPELKGKYSTEGDAMDIHVRGKYAYFADGDNGLRILDVSDPASPTQVGRYHTSWCGDVVVADNYAYAACGPQGLFVIDVSDPTSPVLAASYDTPWNAQGVRVQGNYIYVADGLNGKLLVLELYNPTSTPRINLNRTKLTFAAQAGNSGVNNENQSIFINNTGAGTLHWSVSVDRNWLGCSPSSGIDSGEVLVSVDATGLPAGNYFGTITISDAQAVNSPQKVAVTLKVYDPGQTSEPFGVFATPIDGSTVSGSIPVTGWVLDDMGLQCLEVFREEGNSLVFIGDGVFVEGARPDVEQAYPWYPMNYKAGWGYMLLTNFLPDGGNGTFKIHAVATDIEGNQTTLGVKTIICDNANAVKPFGAIDTPLQGGVASGSDFVNFGWALAPFPNTIPLDGSTIRVWVDGVSLGNPVYNRYREDIAALFPGYNNSNGAGGYFYLDTSQYINGVHTISWSVTDDAGNTDGIGSRYFTIQNQDPGSLQQSLRSRGEVPLPPDISKIPPDNSQPLRIKIGYNVDTEPEALYPDENGKITIETKELEPVEIFFPWTSALQDFSKEAVGLASVSNSSKIGGDRFSGFQVIGNQFRSLPIGSRLNPDTGIFSWTPGPGHYGLYRLLFLKRSTKTGEDKKYYIQINILPR